MINIIDIVDEVRPEMDGIMVSSKIRETNRLSYIIFFTSHDSYLSDVVNSFVRPIAYINKSNANADNIFISTFKKII